MLGGNASSEIRMWVCGAHGADMRETGILEEIMLENLYRNPDMSYSIWDSILYETAKCEENITLILNCVCSACEMDGTKIACITGVQATTQKRHVVRAKLFADCSGDSVLAPLSGAQFRMGREARAEYGESIAPEVADKKTMGMSLLIQAREFATPRTFIPPAWAYKYTKEDLIHRVPDLENPSENFWYLELGGTRDTIADTEEIRDELLKCAYGVWDYIKNAPENREKNKNWQLDWMGMLPGKRESRRYVGDHVLTQTDVGTGGHFEDVVAYGGWTMDDHDPRGFESDGAPNIFHPAPSPYGIPYRCLYSINIDNLLFAGRNISATHAAMSSSRVMGTCALLGQAMGTAAALAIRNKTMPRGVYQSHIAALRQVLMDDDCFLPFTCRACAPLTHAAMLDSACEPLRDGNDRPVNGIDHGVTVDIGAPIEYVFPQPAFIEGARIVFDSDLNRKLMGGLPQRNLPANRPLDLPQARMPGTLVRAYRIEATRMDGERYVVAEETNNKRRMRRHVVGAKIKAIRLIPLATWGARACHLFSFDIKGHK